MFGTKVLQSSSTTGLGPYQVDTSVGEYRDWREAFADGSKIFWIAENDDGTIWEWGWGVLTWGSPDLISRVVKGSSTGAPIDWQVPDAPIVIYSAPTELALSFMLSCGASLGRPDWAVIGLRWTDDNLGVATTWKSKRVISGSSADDVEEGRTYTVPKIHVPSPRKLWVDHGAADYPVTPDDIGSVNLFDVTSADHALTLPAGSTVGHGFALRALGYGSASHNVVVTPNGSDAIDQGAGGATLAVPGRTPFSIEWDQPKGQWRTSYVPAVPINYSLASGFVNALRNGNFVSWPNGYGAFSVAAAASGSACIGANGWAVLAAGAAVTVQQAADQRGANRAMKVTGNSGVTDVVIAQRIEAADAAQLAGKRVTFQATIFNGSGGAITPQIATRDAGSTDNWTSPVADLTPTNMQACPNNTWTTIAYSFDVSANAAFGYEVKLDFGNNWSANTKAVWISAADLRATPGVSVGINSAPAVPELRDIASELDRNARYYGSSYDNGVSPGTDLTSGNAGGMVGGDHTNGSTSNTAISVIFPIPMRAAPTLSYWDRAGNPSKFSFYSGGSFFDNQSGGNTIIGPSTKGFGFYQVATFASQFHYAAYADFW